MDPTPLWQTPTEVVYAQFQQQLGSLMTGNPLYRYLAPDGTGSGGEFNTTKSALDANTSYTASLQHLTELNNEITTVGQIYGFGLTTGAILNVTRASISEFSATLSPAGGVEVAWETASEAGTAGFHLERWDNAPGNYIRVTDEIQRAPLMAPLGSRYRVMDAGALPGETYRYRLVELELDGGERTYGPYTVQVPTRRAAGPLVMSSPLATGAPRGPSEASVERRLQAQSARLQRGGKPSTDSGSRIRIHVGEDGLYRISAANIAANLGLTEEQARAGIARRGFALSYRGDTVAYLVEQANADIFFYAMGIDSIYTRENVYWLDWGKGKLMSQKNAPAGKLKSAPAASYRHRQNYEEDTYFQPLLFRDAGADIWIWDALVADESTPYALATPGAAGTGEATIRARLSGGSDRSKSADHHVHMSVNGVEVGEATWDGFSKQMIEAGFPGELLSGEETTVTLRAVKDEGVDLSWVLVDGFELEYERHFRSVDDELVITANGDEVVQAAGFGSGDILVLDITDTLRPVQVKNPLVELTDEGDYNVTFKSGAGRQYLLSAQQAVNPRLEAAEASDLAIRPRNAEYLVITPDALAAGAEELAAYRSDQYETNVVRLSEIYDAYYDGIASPHAIHAFLKDAHQNWSVKPEFIVLAGKGTYDPKDLAGLGTNLLPILSTATPDGVFPSDMLFADLVGNDHIPEIAIGRLPVLSVEELSAYVEKLRAHEAAKNTGDWRSRALLLADDAEATARFDNESDRVALGLPDFFDLQKVYYQEGSASVAPYTEEIIEQLDTGTLLFNYVGHGSFQILADERLLSLGDLDSLAPADGRYPAFLAFTCLVGNASWLYVDSLAEALVLKPDAGAILAVSPTGNSASSGAHVINAAMLEILFEEPDLSIGQALNLSISALSLSEHPDYMLLIFGLMGDPAIRLGD